LLDSPLEFCPKCNKKLVYIKSNQKKDEVDFEAICLNGHELSFTISNAIRTTYKELIKERIFSCTICGGPAFPDYKNNFKKEINKTSFKVKCKAGCEDNILREFKKELPKECPKCGAPLDEEKLKKLKSQAILDCSNCGLWAMYSF